MRKETLNFPSPESASALFARDPANIGLLEKACGLNIRGGSAFQAIGGFGRHRLLHETRFFELAGSVVVEVEFIVDDDEAERLLEVVRGAGIRVFYARIPAHFGVINPDGEDRPEATE